MARPISKWNSPRGFVATSRYISLTLLSSSRVSTLVLMRARVEGPGREVPGECRESAENLPAIDTAGANDASQPELRALSLRAGERPAVARAAGSEPDAEGGGSSWRAARPSRRARREAGAVRVRVGGHDRERRRAGRLCPGVAPGAGRRFASAALHRDTASTRLPLLAAGKASRARRRVQQPADGCSVTIRECERRSQAGIFLGRDHAGHHHCAVETSLAARRGALTELRVSRTQRRCPARRVRAARGLRRGGQRWQ